MKKPIENKKKVCGCSSNLTAQRIHDDIQYVIPGFNRAGFMKSASVADPLGYILASKDFEAKNEDIEQACRKKYSFR